MVRDDKDNSGVRIAFCVLIFINFALLCYTAWKLKTWILHREQNKHILVLYASILLYSLRNSYTVRIVWYLDIINFQYSDEAYYALEEAPDLLLFTAYSTIACLWLEIYLTFRSQRPCSLRSLQTCRLAFICGNCCIYVTFVIMQIVEASQGNQYT